MFNILHITCLRLAHVIGSGFFVKQIKFNNMDYLSIIFLWLGLATYLAGITYTISMFACQSYCKKTATKHWFNWVGFPLWIIVLIIVSCFVSIVKDSYETKFNVIKKMWIVFGKNLLGDWSV